MEFLDAFVFPIGVGMGNKEYPVRPGAWDKDKLLALFSACDGIGGECGESVQKAETGGSQKFEEQLGVLVRSGMRHGWMQRGVQPQRMRALVFSG
jgi:hypothetical protein